MESRACRPIFSPAQVQKVLDGCDRAKAMGRRDYAILMMLARLGLRANEVATLTLDDIDWRAGEILVCAEGRQRARMPAPPEVGAAVVACLRDGRPTSSCCIRLRDYGDRQDRSGVRRHPWLRTPRGPYLPAQLRFSLRRNLVGDQSALQHEGDDTTRIYAKVDFDALRTLSLPWPGGVQ
jgi:integrase